MTGADVWLLVTAAVLVGARRRLLGRRRGVDLVLESATRTLVGEGRPGAVRLVAL